MNKYVVIALFLNQQAFGQSILQDEQLICETLTSEPGYEVTFSTFGERADAEITALSLCNNESCLTKPWQIDVSIEMIRPRADGVGYVITNQLEISYLDSEGDCSIDLVTGGYGVSTAMKSAIFGTTVRALADYIRATQ